MKLALNLIQVKDFDSNLIKEEEILDYYAFSASKVRKTYLSSESKNFKQTFFTIKLGYIRFALNLTKRILEISKLIHFSNNLAF